MYFWGWTYFAAGLGAMVGAGIPVVVVVGLYSVFVRALGSVGSRD
jgi:hypothetical protein